MDIIDITFSGKHCRALVSTRYQRRRGCLHRLVDHLLELLRLLPAPEAEHAEDHTAHRVQGEACFIDHEEISLPGMNRYNLVEKIHLRSDSKMIVLGERSLL
jgi:hypothetical protein